MLFEQHEEEILQNQRKYEKNTSIFDQLDEIEQKIKQDADIYDSEDENEDECYKESKAETDAFEKEKIELASASNAQPRDEETEKITYDELKKQVRSLNEQQRYILDEVVERVSLPIGVLPPMLLHILGAAGTGKSYLLHTLIAATQYMLDKKFISLNKEQPTIQIGAPTNNSAFQILGQTIHSLLGFGFSGEDESNNTYTNVNGTIAKDLPWKFFNTRLLFLDEISMIGSNMFSKISLRLQEIMNIFPGWKSKSFGGLDLIVLGDFFQLPPVMDRFCFKNSTLRGRCAGLSKNHYFQNVKSLFLTDKVRSSDDPVFGELCDNIAKNNIAAKDLKLLEGRCNVVCPGEDDNEEYKNGNIIVLCLENKRIDEINEDRINRLNKNNQLHEFVAEDKYVNLSEPVGHIDLSYTETQNLPSKLSLKIDTPIIITKNINKKDKLVNGKRGFVHEIDQKNKIIWVQFYEDDVGNLARLQSQHKPKNPSKTAIPIYFWKSPVSFQQFGKRKRGPLVKRFNQFPIVPAYATTVHKSQGLTLKNCIIDFKRSSKRAVQCGAFYTAITRVKSLKNIFLRNFEQSHIRTDSGVLEEIERLKTVPYQFVKPYLKDPVFLNCGNELKVTYLNTNGIISHLEDIKADYNLLRSDVLCFSETKISKDVSAHNLQIPGYTIKGRLEEGSSNSGGMIVYVKTPIKKSITILEKRRKIYKDGFVEQVHLEYIDKTKLAMVYLHPDLASKNKEAMKQYFDDLSDSTGRCLLYTNYLIDTFNFSYNGRL